METALTRKSRLKELEQIIEDGLEEVFKTAAALREIKEENLQTESDIGSFEGTIEGFGAYCRKRYDWSQKYATSLISYIDIRDYLPKVAPGHPEWTPKAVKQFTRIGTHLKNKFTYAKEEYMREEMLAKVEEIGEKIIEEIEKDPEKKLTATFVRKTIELELGLKKYKSAIGDIDLGDFISARTSTIEGILKKLTSANITSKHWQPYLADKPDLIKRLVKACKELAAFFKE